MSGKSRKNGKGCANQKFHKEEYEQIWTIPHWESVQRNEEAVMSEVFKFETGRPARGQTKWLTGLKTCNPPKNCRVYWKLIEEKGFPDRKVEAIGTYTVLKGDLSDVITDTRDMVMIKNQEINFPRDLPMHDNGWGPWINQNGELIIKLKLIINEPEVPSNDLRLELFHKASMAAVHSNFLKLLGDESTADLKIVTSDEKTLFAHRIILKVQCPVFESMFRSEFSESKTGIVKVIDISAKTMEIFLHYFYSGELLSTWKDPDTVVEFTYAVGKYQLTHILKLLDAVLGSWDEEDATHTDIKLLDLARKLKLKNAEKELVQRIKTKTRQLRQVK